ncbi:MAG TPA: SRPBCC family protein [Candidatus Dormibacteraeota bacterium]|nr:SRPBCC family protein [Candidatus Dormibacteraeota bacterium]
MPTTEYTIEPGRMDIVSTVVLDAPRELVFKAYTDPKLFARWWGPRQYTNVMEKFDIRRGGEWRVIQRGADGGEHAFRGVTHSVDTPDKICQTFEYEGVPGHVALQTATFESLGDKTRITAQIVFQSVMDRDGMVAAGMKSGADESMERLAELLHELKGGK